MGETDQHGTTWRRISPQEARHYLAMHVALWEGYRQARASAALDPFAFATDHGMQIRYEEGRRLFALASAIEESTPEWAAPAQPPAILVSVLIEHVRGGGRL